MTWWASCFIKELTLTYLHFDAKDEHEDDGDPAEGGDDHHEEKQRPRQHGDVDGSGAQQHPQGTHDTRTEREVTSSLILQ